MRFRGGYNILLKGKPDRNISVMPEPEVLYLPLASKRFTFSEICVQQGQKVNGGDILAKDPDNYGVPLLAPLAGEIKLGAEEGYVVLDNVRKDEERADLAEKEIEHIEAKMGDGGVKRYKLLSLGAWQFFYDAYTGTLPDPQGDPQAVIVSTVSLEPFLARGDAQLQKRLLDFTRGLEHLQSLLEYQPIYLVLPDITSAFADLVRNHIRGYAWVKMVEIPLTYPYDDFGILARRLNLKRDKGPVWGVRTEGILATDRALTITKPCTVRIISIGGAGVDGPTHIMVVPGYPTKTIADKYVLEPSARLIDGGVLTGEIAGQSLGVETECRGLTVLPELEEREFLGFVRAGWGRSSYTPCFLSALRKRFREDYTSGVRGEGRPCVSCGYCEDVCPAGLMPHLIHKYLYRDLIEEADEARVDLCIECGLCSYVCPSKIDVRGELIKAKELIAKEQEEIRQEQLRQEEARRREAEARKESEENSE
ncbi:MAG: 4Fe-4S dicluster domain-containing protein [Sedimentisphaerales bacterium]|nr:4Fe-4S dicluster domain-containing protein [Sedimentisphaerales bacterium]